MDIHTPARIRRLTGTVLVGLVALVVSSCGIVAAQNDAAEQEGPAAEATGPVTFWHGFTGGSEGAGIKQLVTTFEQQNPQLSVKQRPINNEEMFTVLRTGLGGTNPPDLVQYEGYQQTRDFAAAGQLMDLTELWNANKDRHVLGSSAEQACTYEGKIYCIPYTFATGSQIYYNTELLQKQGIEPPTTYEDFLAAAQKLKDAGVTPIAIGAKDGWPAEHWWMLFLVQRCGVATVDSAMKGTGAKFTDECFVQSARDLADLAQKGYFNAGAGSDDYGTALSVFKAGKSAFLQTGSWFAGGLTTEPTSFTTGILPFPRLSDDQHPGDIVGSVTHVVGISAKAKNGPGARKVLEYLMSDEATTTWAKSGNLSLKAGAVDQNAPEPLQPLWQAVLSAEASLPWLENELPPGVGEDKVYNGTAALVSGRTTPEAFVSEVQTALDAAR